LHSLLYVFVIHETDGGEATRFYTDEDLSRLRERTQGLQEQWENEKKCPDLLAVMDETCRQLYSESGLGIKLPTRSSPHITMKVNAGHITIFRADMWHAGGVIDLISGGEDRVVTFGLFGHKHFMNENVGDTTFPVYQAAAHVYGCRDKR